MDKDIIIIGGGPGGYVAAIRAAQLGASVCVVEMDKMGGTCLNRGCIPTKALYRNAEILHTMERLDEFGIKSGEYTIDVEKIQQRKNGVVTQLRNGVEHLLKGNGIETIAGKAEFKDANTLIVKLQDGTEREITGKNIIIATGSVPTIPDIPGIHLKNVITTDVLLEFDHVPESMAVIGGGTVGVEFAGIFSAMGTKVSVVIKYPMVLRKLDTEMIKRLTATFKSKGIDIVGKVKVQRIEQKGDILSVVVLDEAGQEGCVDAETVLLSIGRRPLTEGLNLDRIGVDYDSKGIKYGESYQTNIKNIYAIGDVTGEWMLAHVASEQGIIAVESIMGVGGHRELGAVPNCVFSFPEIATTGLTEEELKEAGVDYKVGKFLFAANGKALSLGEKDGFVKIITTMDDQIIGVHILGAHASDLIHEGVLAINQKLKIKDILHTIHAHPTLGECFSEAAMAVNDISIHSAPKKK